MQLSCGEISASFTRHKDVIPNEMFYKAVGHCDQGNLVFVMLQAGGILLSADPSGTLHAQQELYLHKNGSFDLRYREFTIAGLTLDKKIHAEYQIDVDLEVINLSGLGQGKVIQDDGRNFLEIQFTANLNSATLKGKSARFRIIKSLAGLDTDRADYCGY